MRAVFGLVTVLFLLGLSPIPTLHAEDGVQTNITVEVLIFSGRPNPTWQLQDTNRLHLFKARLKDLPTAGERDPAEWSRLGFAGFLIRGGEAMGLPGEIRVFRGAIKTGRGKEARYVKDLHGLEQSLIEEARRQPFDAPVKSAIANYENSRKAPQ